MKNFAFWIFGILQSISLGFIIYLIFRTLKTISPTAGIGSDTQLVLSIAFPMFLLIVEYIIYQKIPDKRV